MIDFDDTFESYNLGPFPVLPNTGGWYISGDGNNVIVPDPPPLPVPIPKDPSKSLSAKCLAFGNVSHVISPGFNGDVEFSLMVGQGTQGPISVCSIINTMYPLTPSDVSTPPTPGFPGVYSGQSTAMMIGLTIEKDMTISLRTANSLLQDPITNLQTNSGFTAHSIAYSSYTLLHNIWYFFQFSFGFVNQGGGVITGSGELSIEGADVLTGKSIVLPWTLNSPYVDPDAVYIQPPAGIYNGIAFAGGSKDIGSGCFLDNVTVNGGAWPHPATPPNPHCVVNQMVLEVASISPQCNARIGQIVVERATIPTLLGGQLSAKVRNSQLVVEVMKQSGNIVSGQNWIVKES